MSGSVDLKVKGLTVEGVGRLRGRFQGGVRKMHDRMYDLLVNEADLIAEIARARIAEMFKNPARMQAAIQVGSTDDIGTSSAVVTTTVTATGLPYLAIHEYGGVVMTPEIFPVNVSKLHWMSPAYAQFKRGSTAATSGVFTAGPTRAHPTRIPERSYLRYALAQRREAIRDAFAQAARETLKP